MNKALEDRTRLANALYQLLTAVQVEHNFILPGYLIQAELEAIHALESIGGIAAVTEAEDGHNQEDVWNG